MPIENRELAAGTRLVARYKMQDRTCEIVATADGPRYRLDDGTEHRSPSSAGKAAMDGVACNGWRFWSVEGTVPEREPKAKTDKTAKTKKEPAAEKPAKAKSAKKAKSPKKPKAAKRASGASYGCGVCPETFPTMTQAATHALTHSS